MGQHGSVRSTSRGAVGTERGDQVEPPGSRTRWRAARERIEGHPVLAVAALAILVGAVNVVWTATHRRPGGLDIDEVSYLSYAFQWLRTVDPANPIALYSRVLGEDKAPVTMLVSVITLLLGPNTVATAMAASAVLHGVSAVGVAGITNRLAGARTALVAGLVVLAMPAALAAARSYQFAPAVAAALTLAVWALLASSRGRRLWPMVGFGVAVGLMVMSRTMAVAFVPGLVLASVLHLDWSRRTARNVAISAGATILVAGPWWWSQRGPILDYLLGHGYGDAASGYGANSLVGQVGQRVMNVVGGTGTLLVIVTVVVVICAAVQGRRDTVGPAWVERMRSGTAVVWVTVGLGTAALISTANSGMYFELPLMVLAVSGVAVLGAGLPDATRRPVAAVTVGVALLTLGISMVDTGGRRDLSQVGDVVEATFFPGLANYQQATVEAEPRLGSRDNQIRLESMDEWWDATGEVLRNVDSVAAGEPVVLTVCGSGAQLSAGSLALVSELDQLLRETPIEWLRSSAQPAEMEAFLQPSAGADRILVMIDSKAEPFPGEESVDQCVRTAQQRGWTNATTTGLPDGGTVAVMTHPENG